MSLPRIPIALCLLACLLSWGCAPKPDARTAREEAAATTLTYRLTVDSTRLRKGSGLDAVAAVAQLVEDGLSRFFHVPPRPADRHEGRVVIVAEAPAPGFGVRAVVEPRPDDYVLVTLEAVELRPEGATPTSLAPYSVHFGLSAIRTALAALRAPAWPPMTEATFATLRRQAEAMAQAGQDPPIDEATFAHSPRPLQNADEPPRYYAPPQEGSSLRR